MKGLKITALILTAAIGAAVLTSCNNPKKPVSSGINILSTQNQLNLTISGFPKVFIGCFKAKVKIKTVA